MTKKLKADPYKRDMDDVLNAPDGSEPTFGFGLVLRVQGGSRRWITYYRWPDETGKKKRRTHSIGPVQTVSLTRAREIAQEVRAMVKAGKNPQVEKERDEASQKAIPTFGQHATKFMDGYLPNLKSKNHRDKWRTSLSNHCKHLWNMPVDQVEVRDVLLDLKPIWKKIPVMAAEIRRRIEIIIDDAKNEGYHVGENPAKATLSLHRSLGGKPPASGATRGAMASVPFEDLPDLMIGLGQKESQTARALAAIILSCVRSQEFVQMQRRELDLDGAQPTWTIPYARFKVDPHKQDYQLPLSPQLVAVLRQQIAELEWVYGADKVDYIWPSSVAGTREGGPQQPYMNSATMLKYLRETMGCDATVHGFRASFDTWADDQFLDGSDATPKYHPHAVEFVLAHVAPGGKVKSAYRRGMMFKARIAIMRDWANHCLPPKAADKSNENVVAMRKSA